MFQSSKKIFAYRIFSNSFIHKKIMIDRSSRSDKFYITRGPALFKLRNICIYLFIFNFMIHDFGAGMRNMNAR